jgi:voltage-gated potassium channel
LRPDRFAKRARRSGVVLVTATLVYYLNPAPGSHSRLFNVLWAVGTIGASVAVATQELAGRMKEYGRSGDRPAVGLETLTNVLFIVAILFASGYYALSRGTGQMSGIENHTDALYFSMTVLSTVGFGDIHAVGELGRAVVTVQMLFDLVFVASAVGLVVSSIISRTQRAAAE